MHYIRTYVRFGSRTCVHFAVASSVDSKPAAGSCYIIVSQAGRLTKIVQLRGKRREYIVNSR